MSEERLEFPMRYEAAGHQWSSSGWCYGITEDGYAVTVDRGGNVRCRNLRDAMETANFRLLREDDYRP